MHKQVTAHGSAGGVHRPVPPTPNVAGPREVVALLVPFLHPTPQAIANNLLYLYVQYHLELGFSKFVQYTQVRPRLLPPAQVSCVIFLQWQSAGVACRDKDASSLSECT